MRGNLLLMMILGLVLAGCGDETPPEEGDGDADADGDGDGDGDGDADGDSDGDGDADGDADADADGDPPEYFPLTPGTSWDYDELSPGGLERTLHKEITGCEAITFEDCESGEPVTFDAYIWDSTGSANPDENGIGYLALTAGGVMRVMQQMYALEALEFTQRYSPGFLRFPAPPLDAGREIDAPHLRCETEEATGIVTQIAKPYHWTIEAAEPMDVVAGSFDDCLRMRRVNQDSGEIKLFWFCAGVGKVLEHAVDDIGNILATEELTAYTIGDAACNF